MGTKVLAVRLSDEMYKEMEVRAEAKGLALNALGKRVWEQWIEKTGGVVNSSKPSRVHPSVAVQCEVPSSAVDPPEKKMIDIGNGEVIAVPDHLRVADRPSNMTVPVYDPLVHKRGDRVLMRVGRQLVPMTVPDLDVVDGRIIPE